MQICNVEVSVWSTNNCRNYGGLNLDDLRYFGIFIQHFVRGTFEWNLGPRVLKLYTMNEYILLMCNVEVSVWSITKCRNYRVLNVEEFEIYWDICKAQKDYAYTCIVTWGLRCVDEYVRATVWERRCEKDVVVKTLWDKRCEILDVVEKSLWENHFFFLLTNIRVKKCFA